MKITCSIVSAICLFIGLVSGIAAAQSAVSLRPQSMFFHVEPGQSSTEKATLTNSSTGLEATINSIGIGTQCCGTGHFQVVSHTCGTTLGPRQSCTITVKFTAGQGGEDTKSTLVVKFHIDGVAQTDTTALTGTIGD
jgi:hypothetical protein